MIFLVAAVVWFLVGSVAGEPGVGFFLGIISAVLYSQHNKIVQLEKRVAQTPEGVVPQPRAPVSVTPTAEVKKEPPSEKPIPTHSVVTSTPASQPEPSVAWPVRNASSASQSRQNSTPSPKLSTSEIIEQTLGSTIGGFFLRGNPIARIGVVILFFGVIFALKFAAEEGFFPIELRLLGALVGAFALLGLGWKLRVRRTQFAITLQGASVGIFYITSFIAFKLYHLIPGPLAFGLLVGVTVLSAALAVLQNARSLAVVALIGGFLAPALTSEGGGSHVMLFSYLALLNLGVFGMCWFKAWREVNVTGFVFTFLLGGAWGNQYYRPEFFSTSEPFLIFFFVLYTAIAIVFSIRSLADRTGAVDALMTFGTPLMVTILQYGMVKDMEYGMALSCLGFGAAYIIVARGLFSMFKNSLRFLVESYFSIGLCLLSLAVPLGFSGRVTSAIWALEGVALIWSGIRQRHWLTRFGGEVLVILASVFFLSDVGYLYNTTDRAFLNPYFVGVLLLAFAHLFAAKLLSRAESDVVSNDERGFAPLFVALSVFWWVGGGYFELWRHLTYWHISLQAKVPSLNWEWIPFILSVHSIFASVTVLLFGALARWGGFHKVTVLDAILLPLHMVGIFVLLFNNLESYQSFALHPAMGIGWFAWALFFVTHYSFLRLEEQGQLGKVQSGFAHAWALNLLTAITSWEVFWLVGRYVHAGQDWALATLIVVPACVLLLTSTAALKGARWPFKGNTVLYFMELKWIGLWLFVWTTLCNITKPGSPWPIPYMPILNPLDLAQLFAVIAIFRWWNIRKDSTVARPVTSSSGLKIFGAWSFVWATTILLRSVHHFGGVRWNIDVLLGSNLVQASLSIFWSVLALILMSTAHIKSIRGVWKAGAVLIGIVVVKLFLVDLSSQGTVARIAAFLGVGVLMLCIGYFAPIPPVQSESNKAEGRG